MTKQPLPPPKTGLADRIFQTAFPKAKVKTAAKPKGITKKPAPKPKMAPRKLLSTRIPTPHDIKMAQKADALMLWMASHPYPFQRVGQNGKSDDDIYEVFKANGVPWPCTEHYPSIETAVVDAMGNPNEPFRASLKEIFTFQRCAICSISQYSSHFLLGKSCYQST